MNQSEISNTNETDQFLSTLEPNYPQWIGFLVLETVFLVLGVYLLVAVIYFTIKSNIDGSSSTPIPGGTWLKRIRNILLILLIFYTSTSVMKFCIAPWLYWGLPVSNNTEQCALIGALFQGLHSIGATSLFLFLWLRQHSLQHGIKYLTQPSPHIVRFSWTLFGIIVVVGIAATIAVVSSNSPEAFLYIHGTNACSLDQSGPIDNSIIVFIGYLLIVAMQAAILFLFILVLKRSIHDKTTAFKSSMSTDSTSQKKIHNLIRNCTIAATLSIASNIASAIAYAITSGSKAQLVVDALWDIDNAVSLGSIVFCFSNWQELLLPWPCFGNIFRLATPSVSRPTTDLSMEANRNYRINQKTVHSVQDL